MRTRSQDEWSARGAFPSALFTRNHRCFCPASVSTRGADVAATRASLRAERRSGRGRRATWPRGGGGFTTEIAAGTRSVSRLENLLPLGYPRTFAPAVPDAWNTHFKCAHVAPCLAPFRSLLRTRLS